MIRLVFMCDKKRIAGVSNSKIGKNEFNALPGSLGPDIEKFYKTTNAVVVGVNSLNIVGVPLYKNVTKYCITKDRDFKFPEDLEVIAVSNLGDLVGRYKETDEELLVVGGLTTLKLFLPYADKIDVVEKEEAISGDVVFDSWEEEPFLVQDEVPWSGGAAISLARFELT